jgi:holliday junction DNA helicase RuvA
LLVCISFIPCFYLCDLCLFVYSCYMIYMIRYLRGTLLDKVRNQIILDVNGVGYNLFVSPLTQTQTTVDQETVVHVSESIREDAHDLYGFLTTDERDLFESLRKVPGVGPKVALGVCGFYSSGEIAGIIHVGDATKLSLVPGIGKKMAEKIILELKGKVMPVSSSIEHVADADTVDALRSLGYSPVEIAAILPKVPQTLTSTNERITWILRHLAE